MEASMVLLTLLAAAWAIKAPVFVATVSAICISPHNCRFYRLVDAQRRGNARFFEIDWLFQDTFNNFQAFLH
jgi:hypothetical protein